MKRMSRFNKFETALEDSTTITTNNQDRKFVAFPSVVAKNSIDGRLKSYWANPPLNSGFRLVWSTNVVRIELPMLKSELEQPESPITTVQVERHVSISTLARLKQRSVTGKNSALFNLQYELDNEESRDTELDYSDGEQSLHVEIRTGVNWKNFSSTKEDSSRLFDIQYEIDIEEEE